MDGLSTNASGRGRGVRKARIILGLVGGGMLVALAVSIQESWRLSPPVSRLAARSASRGQGPDSAQAHGRALPRRTVPGPSPVVITEVSAANHDVIFDDDLAPSDWIELYNRTDRPISLAGWRLVESGRPRRGWVFPEITLAPGSYLTVWASGKDRIGSAASRRVNTQLTRAVRVSHLVDDFHTPLPGGWKVREARRVKVDIAVPDTGSYTLWMKARAEGLSGTVRVRVEGSRSKVVTVPGGRDHHIMVGAEGSARLEGPGLRSVGIVALNGSVHVAYVALVRAGDNAPAGDRYARHVHAGFRIGHGREGVTLVDAAGVVRDETPPADHPSDLTLQREPDALVWRVGLPTLAGREFHPGPDLAKYPSLSSGPLRIAPDRLPGVEELRYTLDGSIPTVEAPRLEGPLELTGPTALRLRGYSGGAPVTPVATRQFWVGPLPVVPTLMLALDPQLLSDPEVGIWPNDRWRRQLELPDDPALGPIRLTRSRLAARERRHWIKPADLLMLDGDGVLFDGRARVRKFTHDGYHVRTRDPARPTRDLFARTLGEPGRSVVIDEDTENIPAYDIVRAAGGAASRTAWGLVVLNGQPPDRKVLFEPVDDDFFRARWGHTNFDLIKGRPVAVKRGTIEAFDALTHRLDQGPWTATELAPLIDLQGVIGLHLATLFVAIGDPTFELESYLAFDHETSPPRFQPIGWDLDHGLKPGREDQDTLATQRVALRELPLRDRFLPMLVALKLLDADAAFRERYLRHAERIVNHVLTPAWWEKQRQDVGWSAEPDRAARIARFIRDRPAPLFRSLATGLRLPPPHVARVDVQGRGWVAIDGYPYRSAYTGRYFADGTIQVAVPPEGRAGFRHFTVNGRLEPGPELRAPVTEDLEIVARFGD